MYRDRLIHKHHLHNPAPTAGACFRGLCQIPGQTVPAHIDAALFWGATRNLYPQWLLAAMVFSGLFTDRFVDQVQVVGYLHEWQPESKPDGSAGQFVYVDLISSVCLFAYLSVFGFGLWSYGWQERERQGDGDWA